MKIKDWWNHQTESRISETIGKIKKIDNVVKTAICGCLGVDSVKIKKKGFCFLGSGYYEFLVFESMSQLHFCKLPAWQLNWPVIKIVQICVFQVFVHKNNLDESICEVLDSGRTRLHCVNFENTNHYFVIEKSIQC